MSRIAVLLALVGPLAAPLAAQDEPWVYFARGSSIWRIQADGSQLESVRDALNTPAAMTVSEKTQRLYWVEESSGQLSSIALDGGAVTSIELGLDAAPVGIVATGDKLYWYERGTRSLRATPLEGPHETTIVSESLPFSSHRLGATNGGLLFNIVHTSRIGRVDDEGSVDDEFFWPDEEIGRAFASFGATFCWTSGQRIRCADSGGNPWTAAETNARHIPGLTMDANRILWSEDASGEVTLHLAEYQRGARSSPRKIRSVEGGAALLAIAGDDVVWAGIHGIHRVALEDPQRISTLVEAGGLEIDSLASFRDHIYWIEDRFGDDRIGRSRLDGSQPEILLEERGAESLEVGDFGLRWLQSSRTTAGLRAADLDGTNVRTLLSGHLPSPGPLAASSAHLFQVDRITAKILRTDPQGRDPVTIKDHSTKSQAFFRRIVNPPDERDEPQRMAIVDGDIVFTATNNGRIVRLDSAGETATLIEREDLAEEITWSPIQQRLYWTESSPWSIWSARSGGSDVVKVVEGEMASHLIAHRDWLYWTENDFDSRKPLIVPRIARCRLPACDVEILLEEQDLYGAGFEVDRRKREAVVPAPSGLVAIDDSIYWLSWFSKRLVSARLDGSQVRVLATDIGPRDLLASWRGGLLLYRKARSQVAWLPPNELEASEPRFEELFDGFDVRADALVPSDDRLHFIDWNDSIQRVSLDPPSPEVRGVWPTEPDPEPEPFPMPESIQSLTVEGGRLYRTELHEGRIVSTDLSGEDQQLIVEDLFGPDDLDVHDGVLYWNDAKGISSINLTTGAQRVVLDAGQIRALAVTPPQP